MSSLRQHLFNSKFIIPMLLVVPNILLWSGILAVDGIIIQRDFNFPILNENFEKAYFPLWNDITSQTNIERFPRLVMMSPFIGLLMLGLDVTIISKIMVVGTFSFITCSAYLFLKSLLYYTTNTDEKGRHIKIISIFGAFIFAYNPVNLQFIGGISILASIGMLPLLLHIVLRARTEKKFPLLLILPPLIFSLGHPFVFVMNIIITTIFIFTVYYRSLSLKLILSKLVLGSILLTLLLAWLIVPYLSIPTSSVDLGRDQQLARDTYDLVSDNNYYKITLLERDKFLYTETAPNGGFANTFHYFTLALEVAIASTALTFIPHAGRIAKRIIIFLSGGFIASTLFALGNLSPISEPYWLLISESPIGWIIRSPLKFQLYEGLFISALFAISTVMILKRLSPMKINYNKITICSILLGMIFLGNSSYGIYTANAESFNPIRLPAEYFEINNILDSKSDGSKVIYYPRYNEIATSWSEGHFIPPYDAKSSKIPTYDLSTTYSYVKESLYDYPYTNGQFNSPDFIRFLSSVEIKYIAFHNDRGYAIDRTNLDYLLSSNDLSLLYEKNGWYLFEITGETLQKVHAISGIIETDNVVEVLGLNSKSLAVVDTRLLGSVPTNLDNSLVKMKLTSSDVDVRLPNEIQNPDFSLWNDDSLQGWSQLNPAFRAEQSMDLESNKQVLKLSTNRPIHSIWSSLISPDIPVDSPGKYLATLEAKTENAYGTHAKIQGYYFTENAWKDLAFVTKESKGLSSSPLSLRANSDWTAYTKIVTIPEGVTKMRYIINAGSVADASVGNGITLVKDVGMYNVHSINEGASQSSIINYVKTSPTQYQVQINNQGGPFVLSFSEAFEKGWIASYDGDNEAIKSIPLYGMINGFYIDRTGSFTLHINYHPQELFWYGVGISLLTVIAIAAYSIIPYRNEIRKQTATLVARIITVMIFHRSLRRQILMMPLVRLLEKRNSNSKNRAVLIDEAEFFKDKHIQESTKTHTTEPEFTHLENNRYTEYLASLKKEFIKMVRTNPSSLPIGFAIGLVMCVPFLVTTSEDLANTIAGYALDSLAVGMITGLLLPGKPKVEYHKY